MQCMIRLDDITPDMDWEKFDRAEQIFERYGICPLLGIVPDNRDFKLHYGEKNEAFWQRIRKCLDKGWGVAQHGTYHVYETNEGGLLGLNSNSEFAGLSYEIQLKKIKTGREILQSYGIETDVFMAPGHTYDANTLRALKVCGFQTVTDGLYKRPYRDKGLLFIPCRMVGNYKIKGMDTICLHTNLMKEEDFQRLEKFCKESADTIVPFYPKEYEKTKLTRNLFVRSYEKWMLVKRRVKNKVAHSNKLSWYMEWTNHKNSKIKWMKRIICIPVLLFKR